MEGLADDLVVLTVRSDPEPVNTFFGRRSECSVVETYPNAMQLAVSDLLEV